jgi:hypothetical protein
LPHIIFAEPATNAIALKIFSKIEQIILNVGLAETVYRA